MKLVKAYKDWVEYLFDEYINEIAQSYTISNIPTTDSNVYVNVAKSWYSIQKVIFSLSFNATTSNWAYCSISWDNSNNNIYGISQPEAESTFYIRWRLNWASHTQYRKIPWFVNNSLNTVVFTINRDGNCNIICNWTSTNYTAWTAELNVIQTIMNLNNMNCYASQKWSPIVWNKVDVEVTYQEL